MNCLNCNTPMLCVDDVNDTSIRVDFECCPECGAKADIYYGDNGGYILKVVWESSKCRRD